MRELSSKWTFFYKFVFPTVWTGMFAFGTILMFVQEDSFQGDGDVRAMRWTFLGVTIAGGAILFWFCSRLKKVMLHDDVFSVSNFKRQIGIPVRDVERVSGSILMNPEIVSLHLRSSSEFGNKIVFMPKGRFSVSFSRHPLVRELNALISDPHHHS